jgi:formyltetrahydrofolate synthetase
MSIPVELEAKRLFEENGEKAIDIANRRIENFKNQHSKESDFWYQVLTEIERLIEEINNK